MSPDPVTLMVARRVARGRYQDFIAWLEEGRELAADFAGYLGSGVLAPPPGDDEYQAVTASCTMLQVSSHLIFLIKFFCNSFRFFRGIWANWLVRENRKVVDKLRPKTKTD